MHKARKTRALCELPLLIRHLVADISHVRRTFGIRHGNKKLKTVTLLGIDCMNVERLQKCLILARLG